MRIYYVSISICLFLAIRTLGKSPWNNKKNELLPNVKLIRIKQGRWNPKYIVMVKEKFEKLLEVGFIILLETIEWVYLLVLA